MKKKGELTMGPNTKRFVVTVEQTVVLELDQRVLDAVDDEWRAMLFPLYTDEQIAEHIAFNMIVNQIPLTSIDGFADQSDDRARSLGQVDTEVSATCTWSTE